MPSAPNSGRAGFDLPLILNSIKFEFAQGNAGYCIGLRPAPDGLAPSLDHPRPDKGLALRSAPPRGRTQSHPSRTQHKRPFGRRKASSSPWFGEREAPVAPNTGALSPNAA